MYENTGHTIDNKFKLIQKSETKRINTNIRHRGSFNSTFSQLLNVIEPVHGFLCTHVNFLHVTSQNIINCIIYSHLFLISNLQHYLSPSLSRRSKVLLTISTELAMRRSFFAFFAYLTSTLMLSCVIL